MQEYKNPEYDFHLRHQTLEFLKLTKEITIFIFFLKWEFLKQKYTSHYLIILFKSIYPGFIFQQSSIIHIGLYLLSWLLLRVLPNEEIAGEQEAVRNLKDEK